MKKDIKNKGKKGNIFDLLFIAVFIFVLAITMIFGSKILTEISTEFNSTYADDTINLTNGTMETLNDLSGEFPVVYDSAFLIIYILLNIGVVISAFWVRSHPIFFFVSIILLIIFVFLTMIFSNTYFEIMSQPDLIETADQFDFLTLIMLHLPKFTIVFSVLTAIVLYAKGGGE